MTVNIEPKEIMNAKMSRPYLSLETRGHHNAVVLIMNGTATVLFEDSPLCSEIHRENYNDCEKVAQSGEDLLTITGLAGSVFPKSAAKFQSELYGQAMPTLRKERRVGNQIRPS